MLFIGHCQINTISNHLDRQLDLIFAYDQQLVLVDKCIRPLPNVDLYHTLLLTVGVINDIPDDNMEFKVEKLNFRKCNFESISYLLDSVNFTEIFENNEIDENVELFYSILFDIFKKYVAKSRIYESAKIPWSNKKLLSLRKLKNFVWNTYTKTKSIASLFCQLFRKISFALLETLQ